MLWGLMFAAITPVRLSFLNGLIAARERATVLSFDSLLASSGAVVAQPVLGKTADVWGYPASYIVGAAIQALSLPFIWQASRERSPADATDAPAEAPEDSPVDAPADSGASASASASADHS